MDSIGNSCNDLKKEYDACFNSWFADQFLKGNTNDKICAPMFKVYQECVKVSKIDKSNNDLYKFHFKI